MYVGEDARNRAVHAWQFAVFPRVNVALEARSVGLPVVSFDRGAMGELVAHRETGYMCSTMDVAGVLEGARYFLDRPLERDRASANSLATSGRPDNDCTAAEFERRWGALFERVAERAAS